MRRGSRLATRRWRASISRATSSTRSGTTPSLHARHNTPHVALNCACVLSPPWGRAYGEHQAGDRTLTRAGSRARALRRHAETKASCALWKDGRGTTCHLLLDPDHLRNPIRLFPRVSLPGQRNSPGGAPSGAGQTGDREALRYRKGLCGAPEAVDCRTHVWLVG